MKTKEQIIDILKSLKNEAKSKYHIKLIGLFGSYAREQQHLNSDIDILIDFLDEATLFDWTKFDSFLEHKINLKVDTVPQDSLREGIKSFIFRDLIEL